MKICKRDLSEYLEYKILNNESSIEEDELYIDLKYKNNINKYYKLIADLTKEMSDET